MNLKLIETSAILKQFQILSSIAKNHRMSIFMIYDFYDSSKTRGALETTQAFCIKPT